MDTTRTDFATIRIVKIPLGAFHRNERRLFLAFRIRRNGTEPLSGWLLTGLVVYADATAKLLRLLRKLTDPNFAAAGEGCGGGT